MNGPQRFVTLDPMARCPRHPQSGLVPDGAGAWECLACRKATGRAARARAKYRAMRHVPAAAREAHEARIRREAERITRGE